jgi:hypothetical protein
MKVGGGWDVSGSWLRPVPDFCISNFETKAYANSELVIRSHVYFVRIFFFLD